jgi:hypothetical protein
VKPPPGLTAAARAAYRLAERELGLETVAITTPST